MCLQPLWSYCRHSNVVILTTSNVTEKIDLAFIDRADIKQYIGPPSVKGIYSIYLSCLEELMKVTIAFFPSWMILKQNPPSRLFYGAEKVYFYGLVSYMNLRGGFTQSYLETTNLFRSVSVQICDQINAYVCAVSGHLPSRAALHDIWAWDNGLCKERGVRIQSVPEEHRCVSHGPKCHCTLTSNTSRRIRDLHCVCLFTPRKSKGLSGRSLRKLPFLAHALFVKVNIYSRIK